MARETILLTSTEAGDIDRVSLTVSNACGVVYGMVVYRPAANEFWAYDFVNETMKQLAYLYHRWDGVELRFVA